MTESNTPAIHETEHYRVVVGVPVHKRKDDVVGYEYLIVNKATEVIEAENRVLAYAKAWCTQFEELLATFEETQTAKQVTNPLPFGTIPTPPPPT